jgi:hypothetical protein
LVDGLPKTGSRQPAGQREERLDRPLDMLAEEGFGRRLVDLVFAAFVTRYVLAIGVGAGAEPPQVFAPADPLKPVGAAVAPFVEDLRGRVGAPTADTLRRIWFATDRANGDPGLCRVHDWRNYSARISYIANLFVVSAFDGVAAQKFTAPVFTDEEMAKFLSGRLPGDPGIELTSEQARIAATKIQEDEANLASGEQPLTAA